MATKQKYNRIDKLARFTLIELLVVIAIIGVLASFVIDSLNESREKSLNVARASQVKEYQKAFELFYTGNGRYPMFGTGVSATVCLGSYPDGGCWQNGTGNFVRTAFDSLLVPKYIGSIHQGETYMFGAGASSQYEGIIYTHLNSGRSYSIQYYMHGNNKSCLIAGAVATNVGVDTHCRITIGS